MREFGKLLGWIGFWAYIILLLNFFVKYVNKRYINKLPKDKKKYADMYRFIMRYIVKYHRIIGIIAPVSIIGHFYFMYSYIGLSVPGLIATIIMFVTVLLGIYGVINKNIRGSWLKVHRFLAFILIFLVIFHVMFKRFLIL
ncbi:succinate dehydrogenase hydrophobic anchor subunit [Clostridium algifaecis]|uniref:Succinate dehydrogenase hydrophobic anchor subunit n=1 Tax=Clostridium algifaecis TaxID=1472040 RepID=A0ABS4KTU8_9CLOT|nr:hypothetical protein [Clostridium algifaecis]MBP2033445.1 succinate dehydrogenase hydrophobic anchor subunit [Clostridium algifaecis]